MKIGPTQKIRMATVILILSGCATPQSSCDTDYDALKAAEIRTIEAGESVLRKVIVDGVAEEDLSAEDLAAAERMDAILASRTRIVDTADVAILDRALTLIPGQKEWDRADDRECAPDDTAFSLFCALKRASEETIGAYEHRRTALQEVRFAIEDARPGVEYEHRLQGFNNDPSTSLDEVRGVLIAARNRVALRLQQQSACTL